MASHGQLMRMHEQREAARRERDFQRAEITKYYGEQRAADAMNASMLKDELKHHSRKTKQREAQQQLLESLQQAETSRQLAAITAAEAEALTAALGRQMQVQQAASKEVQRLCEESAELRE
jgi:hypothetical protein